MTFRVRKTIALASRIAKQPLLTLHARVSIRLHYSIAFCIAVSSLCLRAGVQTSRAYMAKNHPILALLLGILPTCNDSFVSAFRLISLRQTGVIQSLNLYAGKHAILASSAKILPNGLRHLIFAFLWMALYSRASGHLCLCTLGKLSKLGSSVMNTCPLASCSCYLVFLSILLDLSQLVGNICIWRV